VEAGELIRVPRGTWHWFDLCAERRIRAIRLFQDTFGGWTPHYRDSCVDLSRGERLRHFETSLSNTVPLPPTLRHPGKASPRSGEAEGPVFLSNQTGTIFVKTTWPATVILM
jgi:hypothetical protein